MRQAQLSWWRRARSQLGGALRVFWPAASHPGSSLERELAHLRAAQSDLQRRWKYLAEAQGLVHAGTFIWKAGSQQLAWSDETYEILGVHRETSPTLGLVLDRIHPDDQSRVQKLVDDCEKEAINFD